MLSPLCIESGLKIIDELSKLTGVEFSTPIGFTGSFTRMETAWLKEIDSSPTPLKYMNESKVHAWINYCQYLEVRIPTCRFLMTWIKNNSVVISIFWHIFLFNFTRVCTMRPFFLNFVADTFTGCKISLPVAKRQISIILQVAPPIFDP